MIYNYKKSSFDELLNKDETVAIHHQVFQKLGIKMVKAVKDKNLETGNQIFRVTILDKISVDFPSS